jgi:hypothetical protein
MTQRNPYIRLTRRCGTSPEVVYGVLANLRSHLEWGGAKQSADFRLLSMEAPDGVGTVGTRFRTVGSIPMSARRWRDESLVTVADPARAFEFVTQATAGAMAARYRHRYDIDAEPEGCRVTYTMTQEHIERPVLRLGLPVMRWMTWRFAIPMFAGRGFGNLVTAAEASSRAAAVAVVG